MGRLSASRVNSVRGIAAWCIRGVAVVLFVLGSCLVLGRVMWHIAQALWPTIAFYHGVWEIGAPFSGVALMIVAAALGLPAPAIARWMIPVLPESCPRCGYAGAGAKCAECGLELREEERSL
jgi:hypothetical protein